MKEFDENAMTCCPHWSISIRRHSDAIAYWHSKADLDNNMNTSVWWHLILPCLARGGSRLQCLQSSCMGTEGCAERHHAALDLDLDRRSKVELQSLASLRMWTIKHAALPDQFYVAKI